MSASASCCISTLAVQGDGKILVAGAFAMVNGEPRQGLARLHANGSVDPLLTSQLDNGSVSSLILQEDGRMVIGGDFTGLNEQEQRYLGRLSPEGNLDLSFKPVANGAVNSLAMQADGRILLGGDLTEVAGRLRSGLARLWPSGGAFHQALAIDSCGTGIIWSRLGPGPLPTHVLFELSLDGVEYTPLGGGVRINQGWFLGGLSLPDSTTFHVRARGQTIVGHHNGSSGLVEQKETFYISKIQPEITGISPPDPDGAILLAFKGTAGLSFTVEISIDLLHWESWTNLTAEPDCTFRCVDTLDPTWPARFYRLRTP